MGDPLFVWTATVFSDDWQGDICIIAADFPDAAKAAQLYVNNQGHTNPRIVKIQQDRQVDYFKVGNR